MLPPGDHGSDIGGIYVASRGASKESKSYTSRSYSSVSSVGSIRKAMDCAVLRQVAALGGVIRLFQDIRSSHHESS